MSLLLITNPPTSLTVSSQWGDFVNRSGKNMLGYGLSIPVFSLTNWDATTTKPEIASGSIIEVGGSFYQADSDTSLTDESGISDGTVHIKLVPAGGGASVVPTLTNDAIPAWSAVKAGWYDNDDKFLPYEMTKASAVYSSKGEYQDQNKFVKFNVNSSGLETPTANITTNNVVTQNMTGQMNWKYHYQNNDTTSGTFYDAISSWIPNVGDSMPFCSGSMIGYQLRVGSIVGIKRISTTVIWLYYVRMDTEANTQVEIQYLQSDNVTPLKINIMSNEDAITATIP